MKCQKCGCGNVNVQVMSNVNSRGGTIPLWYWWSFAWIIDMCLYCCVIGFFGLTIRHFLKRSAKKTKTSAETYAICQDCGYKWKV